MHMRVACKTDRGKMRPNNEDSVLVDMEHAAAQLIHAANTQGGLDNITVVLVKV